MRDRWFKSGLTAFCLALSVPVFATNYLVFPDGSGCTLEEAVTAINTRADVGDCPAGTGNDRIRLLPQDELYYNIYKTSSIVDGDDKKALTKWIRDFADYNAYKQAAVYTLASQLQIGGQLDVDNNVVRPSVTLEIFRNTFDKVSYSNALLEMEAGVNERMFFVHRGANLTVKNVTLDAAGADLSALSDPEPAYEIDPDTNNSVENPLFGLDGPNGGVIYTKGGLFLEDGALITGGLAKDGGGIYLDGGTGSIALSLKSARINANEATANGGGIAMPGLVQPDLNDLSVYAGAKVTFLASLFNISGNKAGGNGGGAYLDGARVDTGVSSGTFYGNEAIEGAAVYIAAGDKEGTGRSSKLNNVTLFGNTGTTVVYYADLWQANICNSSHVDNTDPVNPVTVCDDEGNLGAPGAQDPNDPMIWIADASKRVDHLLNSVVIADAGADGCGGVGGDADYLRVAYSFTDSACALPDILETGSLPVAQASAAEMLVGKDPTTQGRIVCSAGSPCEPIGFGKEHYNLAGFFPSENAANTLVNFASPDDETSDLICYATDGRDINREDRCDIGAIEIRIAKGATDHINNVVTGKPVWLDVLKNDLGDTTADCSLIPAFDPNDPDTCLRFELAPQYGGTVEVVFVSGPLVDDDDGTPVYMTTDADDAVVNSTGAYPLVKYTSAKTFHGQDQFIYELDRDAVTGSTFSNVSIRAQANIAVAPVDNFKSDDIGSMGGGFIALLTLLGLLRKKISSQSFLKTGMAALAMLLASVSTAWADIKVTAHDGRIGETFKGKVVQPQAIDPGISGDGLCSLSEAIQRAFDSYPVANNDCAAGATGTDTIKLPEGTITLRGNLIIPENNAVIIEGAGVNKSVISGDGAYRISTSSYLALRFLTFREGSAANGGAVFTNNALTLDRVAILDSEASANGGAIYLNYSGNIKRELEINRAYFKGNKAVNGGVIYTVGQSMKVAITIDGSTFDQNEATVNGGVIAANLAQGSGLSVINSIFNNNTAARGSAIDLSNAHEDVRANLLNNTFYENTGSTFIDSGNRKTVTLSHSIVAASDSSTIACSSEAGASSMLRADYYNLYTPSEHVSCGNAAASGSTAMAASFADVTDIMNGGSFTADLVLDDGTPVGFLDVASSDASDNYVPPVFELLSPLLLQPFPDDMGSDPANPVSTPIILDRGNKASLAAGVSSVSVCRSTDIRGKSRQAVVINKDSWEEGDATCDIGAYEVQLMTALGESTSVLNTLSGDELIEKRVSRANVLFNDLPSDNAETLTKIGFAGNNGHILNLEGGVATEIGLQQIWSSGLQPGSAASPAVPGSPDCVIDSAEPEKSTCIYADDDQNTHTSTYNLVSLSPATEGIGGTLKWVEMTGGDPACRPGEQCGLMFEMGSADVEAALSAGHYNLVCPDGSSDTVDIPYVVYDDKENIDSAVYSVGLRNLPPQFVEKGKRVSTIEVNGRPDKPVTIRLTVVDTDGHIWDPNNQPSLEWQNFYTNFLTETPDAVTWEAISMTKGGDPSHAVVDPALAELKANSTDPSIIHPAWGTGVKWNGSVSNPVLTYTRANKTQFFTDRFSIDVRDNCGEVSTLNIVVKFPNPGDEGGNGLIAGGKTGLFGSINVGGSGSGAGSFGWGLLGLLALGWRRRQRMSVNAR